MNAFSSKFLCHNRKSKIENLKWAGIFVILVAFALSGAVAQAQQTGKVARIGFLERSTASGSAAVLLGHIRQELSGPDSLEIRNLHDRSPVCRSKTSELALS